jgi:hypothetical protein
VLQEPHDLSVAERVADGELRWFALMRGRQVPRVVVTDDRDGVLFQLIRNHLAHRRGRRSEIGRAPRGRGALGLFRRAILAPDVEGIAIRV